MSVHSGFNSRINESTYIKLIESLIDLLSERVIKAILSQPSDDSSFARHIVSIYSKMSKLEISKLSPPKFSNNFHDLAVFLANQFPDSRCNSSDSSQTKSDYSQPSPIPFESILQTAKPYLFYQGFTLDEIEEEDLNIEAKQEEKGRFHSQPRKMRDISPMKNNFRHSLARNYNKPNPDIVGKYMKMSENFVEKNKKKEESLYFSNGIFFHMP